MPPKKGAKTKEVKKPESNIIDPDKRSRRSSTPLPPSKPSQTEDDEDNEDDEDESSVGDGATAKQKAS